MRWGCQTRNGLGRQTMTPPLILIKPRLNKKFIIKRKGTII